MFASFWSISYPVSFSILIDYFFSFLWIVDIFVLGQLFSRSWGLIINRRQIFTCSCSVLRRVKLLFLNEPLYRFFFWRSERKWSKFSVRKATRSWQFKSLFLVLSGNFFEIWGQANFKPINVQAFEEKVETCLCHFLNLALFQLAVFVARYHQI